MQSVRSGGGPAAELRPPPAAAESVVNELPGGSAGRGPARFALLWFGIPLLFVFLLEIVDAPELLSRWIAHVGF